MKNILLLFELSSGLKINFNKISLFGMNLADDFGFATFSNQPLLILLRLGQEPEALKTLEYHLDGYYLGSLAS
ncbi:hypothetical protein Lal_00000851 [Lupinus albus]|nr:hypothetical protein Lal_00000851 [Lupinus albus]